MENLSSKLFKAEFVDTFPGDDSGNVRPRQTPGALYSKAVPTPVQKPELLAWSGELADSLGVAVPNTDDIKILGGNLVTPSMQPMPPVTPGTSSATGPDSLETAGRLP
jgi:hypothetical protein